MRSGLLFTAAVVGGTLFCIANGASAQPAAGPLRVQGLDQWSAPGARARAMGGTAIANGKDANALFSNPATLSGLQAAEVRATGMLGLMNREQTQAWVPLKNLPGLSVLFEGLTPGIKIPVDTGGNQLSPWNTLQRQYDDIGPNWRRKTNSTDPLGIVGALPLTFAGVELVAGFGVSQFIDLGHYYQNNNSMTPYLGHERPYGAWSNPTDTIHVKWYQFARSRDGMVYGVTPGFSVKLLDQVSVGGSVTILTGSSDDLEQRVERGHLNIAVLQGEAKNFMLDTVYYSQMMKGTSTYKGTLFTFGLHIDQPRYSLGVTIKPKMTLTRSWEREVSSIDSTEKPFPVRIDSLDARSSSERGTDDVAFPFSYALGVVVRPTDRWVIAFDYEMRSLADVSVTSESNDVPSRPWINSNAAWRLGAEFCATDQLALRCGYHEDTQTFAPDGAALVNEPARGEVYSIGAGYVLGNILIDVAYEYSRLKYQDVYQSNTNTNDRSAQRFIAEIGYRF